MDVWNTNRARLSVRRFRPAYAERFHLFRATTWRSRDHGKTRPERNLCVEACGIVLVAKWRPDGK